MKNKPLILSLLLLVTALLHAAATFLWLTLGNADGLTKSVAWASTVGALLILGQAGVHIARKHDGELDAPWRFFAKCVAAILLFYALYTTGAAFLPMTIVQSHWLLIPALHALVPLAVVAALISSAKSRS